MQEIRKTIDRTVFGLILYTLLRYAVFAAEPLARKCWVWLTIPDSSRRQEVLTQLNSSASGSGVSSIAAVCVGVLFLGWYFRKSTPPGKLFSQRQPLPLKGFLLLSCIFMGAQLIYSLFGNSLELLLRLCGYTAMGQLDAASAQSTTLSMFLYTAVFAPVGEELIYRGLVMPQFQRYGKVFAIVTSALLFGVMHANLFQMPFAFLTGLVLGYTAAEFSLRWSILLHLLNNPPDQFFCPDMSHFCLHIQYDPVDRHILKYIHNICRDHIISPLQICRSLRHLCQSNCPTCTDPQFCPFILSCCLCKLSNVTIYPFMHKDFSHFLL